jgi:hypothetical protein
MNLTFSFSFSFSKIGHLNGAATPGIPTLRIMTLSITTFSIMTLSTKGFYVTLEISDSEHK